MDGSDQERAVASLTTAQSGLVTVTSPSTGTLKMLSVHLDDARRLYLIARKVNLPGSEELHLELGDADPSKTRRRVFVTDRATANVAIDKFDPAVKQRISALSLDCSEARLDALSLIAQGQGKWSSCKSLCLTFDEEELGSFLSFFFGRRQVLDADAFPALELLVICCTHPDLPPLEEAAIRLRIRFLPALRALLSLQRLENVEIIYTRDPEVALECTHARKQGEDCPQKWIHLQ
ncbi:hypothetical protein EXIGLDRAFT_170411 [Exidia glandulosa HHB12029]|uniref:Uncharacterized protein n=1 Tax=Exidia glandulosa HHB12029 TaxID=1314781 RepID=A0A165FBX5_EXIGL|nr:hypothetical protein EXIGLDRAFT_170411 [Exidia glandulosa HHB12029]